MKKFLSILLSIWITVSLTGCFYSSIGDSPSINANQSALYEISDDIDMVVDYNSYLGYSAEIKGKLTNISNKAFSYISVTFAIFDENGNQIETALDNMNYLQAGNSWMFTATMLWTELEPKSCKLVDITII